MYMYTYGGPFERARPRPGPLPSPRIVGSALTTCSCRVDWPCALCRSGRHPQGRATLGTGLTGA